MLVTLWHVTIMPDKIYTLGISRKLRLPNPFKVSGVMTVVHLTMSIVSCLNVLNSGA